MFTCVLILKLNIGMFISARLQLMVVGASGVLGAIVLGPAAEEYSILFVPVTTPCQRMEASTAKARGSSTAPVTPKPAPTPTVRDFGSRFD